MNETQPETEATELPKGEQVLLLPGHLFFIETVPVPADVDPREIASFAELSLESLAPFPVEQLNWGYCYTDGSPGLVLFAAHGERLKREGYTGLEAYAWVLPEFASVALAEYPENTEVLFEGPASLALLHASKEGHAPQVVLTAPRPETHAEAPAPEPVARAFAALRARAPEMPLYSSTLHVRPTGIELNDRALPAFHHEAADATMAENSDFAEWTTVRPAESALWRADVRLGGFKQQERGARRLSRSLARATGWAAIVAVLLLLGEFLLFGGWNWLEGRQQTVEGQASAVRRVQDQQSLMLKLDQVAQNELRPVDMLSMANDLRLELDANIEYDETVIEGQNRLTIEGKAGSVNEFNTYVDRLRNSGNFQVIGDPRYSTSRGQTIFTVTMDYVPRESPDDADAPPGDEPVESAAREAIQPEEAAAR